jgi:hypothetical protein
MSDHHFDSSTNQCLGCDIDASAIANAKAPPACPSRATLIADDDRVLAVIVAPDRLIISDAGGIILRLGRRAALALGAAIR